MHDTNKISNASVVKWIDYALIFILSVFCLKYVTYFGRFFAENSLKFPFLNFPVFVGEFLLAGCLFLFLLRLYVSKSSLNKWHYAVILFFCFVLCKAFWGYAHWGPLALRDSALFYYPLFAVISFVCYRASFFNKWMMIVFYLALIWLFFDSRFNEYWLMPRIFLGLVFAFKFPDRRVGAIMALGVLLLTPYRYFLDTSRSVMLGNFIATSFVLILYPAIVDQRRRMVFIGCNALILIALSAYIFHFSGYRAAQGLLAVDKLGNVLNDMERVIDEKRSTFKQREVEAVMIYSPEQMDRSASSGIPVSQQAVSDQPETATPDGKAADGSSSDVQGMKLGNSVFRILLWKDAVKEINQQKKPFGIDFGKPFRSENLEIVRAAAEAWQRDGWIAMHNSYLNLIYRAGLVGVGLIVVLVSVFVHMVKIFLRSRSLAGLLLCGALLMPLVAAFFAVTLELPYTAIPIWSLFGLTLAYAHQQRDAMKSGLKNSTTGKTRAHSHCS